MLLHLANSHRWLYDVLWRLREEDDLIWTSRIEDADVVIFPDPPWHDHDAPCPLRKVPARALLRLYTFSTQDHPFLWAPGVFTSVRKSSAGPGFRGGFYIPIHHEQSVELRTALEPRPDTVTEYLWSFVGTVRTAPRLRGCVMQLKDERAQAVDATAWTRPPAAGNTDGQTPFDAHVEQLASTFAKYAESIHRAKFVVCPRGIAPSSQRLFEAMQAGRCPVIISDEWLPPIGVDWDTCSIRVAEADVKALPQLLRERESEAEQLGAEARRVWRANYAPERRLATLARSCIDIHESLKLSSRLQIAAGGVRTGLPSGARVCGSPRTCGESEPLARVLGSACLFTALR